MQIYYGGHRRNNIFQYSNRYYFFLFFPNRRPPKIMRGTGKQSFGCTGEKGPAFEDNKDWGLGWCMLTPTDPNCTEKAEFKYETPAESETTSISASPKSYGGGGYVLRFKGYITDMEANINLLKKENWIDNRTRSLVVEFAVYNAQVLLNDILVHEYVTCKIYFKYY